MDDIRTVRIAVIGDEGVGKTRFIRTCLAEAVVDDDPSLKRTLPHINLVKKGEVTTVFMDTAAPTAESSKEEREMFEADVRAADVVLLVYNACPPGQHTREALATAIRARLRHWLARLRLIRGDESNVPPVVLVGTHMDARSAVVPSEHADEATLATFYETIENVHYQEDMQPIFSEYPEVDGGYEVSCSLLLNIRAALLNAHRAVVYPMGPIYNVHEKSLTPLFRDRLKRIFTLCDRDGDGVLGDADIQFFNHATFEQDLPSKDLEHVKRIACYSNPAYVDSTRGDAVRFEGFCFWLTVFAEKHEEEVPWQVAYAWGYDRKLQLRSDHLCPHDLYFDTLTEEDLEGPSCQVLQLTAHGLSFVEEIFARRARGSDVLTFRALEHLFLDMSVEGVEPSLRIPWKVEDVEAGRVVPVADKGITLQSFVGLWQLLLADNSLEALRSAVSCASFLGYTHEAEEPGRAPCDAPFVKSFKTTERSQRTLFHCLVLSADATIREGVIRMLTQVPTPGPRCCGPLDGEKHLVVDSPIQPTLTRRVLSHYDCVIFAYGDEPGGWEHCERFAEQIRRDAELREVAALLFLHVAKDDKAATRSLLNVKKTATKYCRDLSLALPLSIESEAWTEPWNDFKARFLQCVTVTNEVHKVRVRSNLVVALGVGIFGLAAALVWYYLRGSKSPSVLLNAGNKGARDRQ